MSDGRIIIDTKIDTKGLDDGLKEVKSKMDGVKGANFDGLKDAFSGATKDAKIFGMSLSDIGGAMSSSAGMAGLLGGAVGALTSAFIDLAMRAIQMAISAFKDFIAQGVELASSIQESMNVIEVTFGDVDVAKWGEEIGKSFNLAQDEAMKFAGSFGTIAKQMTNDKQAIKDISKTLTALAGDMASFYNYSNEEAFNALRAGLTGEMEQLKKFNVFLTEANLQQYALSQGIDQSVRSMTEQEKQLLRLNYIMEQTKDVQGDAIRTQDSYANATKQLELAMKDSAKLVGDEMLPALTEVKQMVADFFADNKAVFSLLGNIFGVVIRMLGNILDIGVKAFKPFLDVLNLIGNILNPIIDGLEEMTNSIKKFFGTFTDTGKSEVDAMGVYMNDFSDVSIKSMEDVAEATGDAFSDTRKAIESELDSVKSALDKYYDDDLKKYRKSLEDKYGESKNAQIKIEKMVADREARNNRLMQQDLQNEEKKMQLQQQTLQKQNEAYKAQEEALKRQSQLVEQETKKQKGFWDDMKKAWDGMFKGGSGNMGYAGSSYGSSRSAIANSYSNYSRSSNTSNTFNVSLYGADFMSSMEQVQMMSRLRG